MLKKQIMSWFIKRKTCFLNEYLLYTSYKNKDALFLPAEDRKRCGVIFLQKLIAEKRVRHLNLGIKYDKYLIFSEDGTTPSEVSIPRVKLTGQGRMPVVDMSKINTARY